MSHATATIECGFPVRTGVCHRHRFHLQCHKHVARPKKKRKTKAEFSSGKKQFAPVLRQTCSCLALLPQAQRAQKWPREQNIEDGGELKKKTTSHCVRGEPRCDGISPIGVAKCHRCFPTESRQSTAGYEEEDQKKRGLSWM